MFERKILASDYDGTIYINNDISEENRAAIAAWQRAGHLFVLVTGRFIGQIKVEAKQRKLALDYILGNCGAVILGTDGTPARQALCESQILKEVIPFSRTFPDVKHMCVFSGDDVYTCFYQDSNGTVFTEDASPDVLCGKISSFHGLSVGFDDFQASRLFVNRFNELFGEKLTGFYSGGTIDVVPIGVSKATGIAALAEMVDVKKENIYCVGDGENDLPMLEAYHGYIMSTASPELQEKVGSTVESVADLIYQLLEESR